MVDSHKVRYTEIDLNGHLNNTSYVEYILNTHDNEFYKHNRISSININYDKEIKNTEIVDLFSNKESPEIIKGRVNGENRFTAKIEYEKR